MPTLFAGLGVLPGQSPYAHLPVTVSSAGRTVREALAKALRPHGLTVVVVGDTALVTTPEKAAERQLGQSVHVAAEGVPLKDLLQRLARETGANVVLDQRLTKEGQATPTAKLDDVPLETAVEVLADQAGLKSVCLTNVLYVTTEARAEKLHRPAAAAAPPAGWQVWPDGNGGFRLTPPAGMVPGGIGGFVGLAGIGGLPGGAMLGALGVGGFAGGPGAAPPMPLTPALPATRPAPVKPKADAAPTPEASPDAGGSRCLPAPDKKPDKKPDPANVPQTDKPKSRRRNSAHRRV